MARGQLKRRSWSAITGKPTTISGFGITDARSLAYANTSVPGGNTVANTTDETAFSSAYIIPAGTMVVGQVWRITLMGVYSTAIISPGTVTGKVKLGSSALLTTGAVTTVANLADAGWIAHALGIVRSIGGSGSIEAQGYASFATAASAALAVHLPNTAVVGSINTTGTLAVSATVQWSAMSLSNIITLRSMVVEVLNS